MTDRAIQVGDLVVQAGTCCARHPSYGMIGTVAWIGVRRSTRCYFCNTNNVGLVLAGCTEEAPGVPVSYLKRIPPAEELGLTNTDEPMKEPA